MSHNLDVDSFAELLGIDASEFSPRTLDEINSHDFRYSGLTHDDYTNLILGIIKKIDSGGLTISGPEEKAKWIKGWDENLQEFIDSGFAIDTLVPKYVRSGQPIRIFGDYANPENQNFELDFTTVLKNWLFETYLKDVDHVYEFGCGTGYDLVRMAKMYPNKELHGFDWVESTKRILNLLHEKLDYNITGHVFDMFNPDYAVEIKENSAFYTVGSLEQLGKDFEPFIQFILEKKPAIVINLDTYSELYSEDNLSDYLALKYDRVRNYLFGYISRLSYLHAMKKIEMIKTQYVPCGSLYHTGYSFTIWRVL